MTQLFLHLLAIWVSTQSYTKYFWEQVLTGDKSSAQDFAIAMTTSVYIPYKVKKLVLQLLLHSKTTQLVQNVKSNYTN